VFSFDSALRAWIVSHDTPLVDSLMVMLSDLGARGFVWFVLGVVLICLRPARARGVWQMALAIGLAVLIVDGVLKPTFRRARPFATAADVRVIAHRPITPSFPSGHTATAFAGGLALARVWPEARLGLWTLACLIAFSRIYVGVHYPLDVLAGAIVGVAAAIFAIGGTRWPNVEGAQSV
jgi:undecaprenyl-diphosphatase